jgi:hypothetical protein
VCLLPFLRYPLLHQQNLFRISSSGVIGILQTTVLLPHDLLQTVLLNGTQKRLPYEYAQKQYKSLLPFLKTGSYHIILQKKEFFKGISAEQMQRFW